jgi:hypothetical protein
LRQDRAVADEVRVLQLLEESMAGIAIRIGAAGTERRLHRYQMALYFLP